MSKPPYHRSLLGAILAALYILVAAIIAYDAYGCSGGNFPFPCDFLLALVIFPLLPLVALLEQIGVGEPSFNSPGPHADDMAMMTLYVLLCATLLYLLGYGIEKLFRHLKPRIR